MGYFPFTVKNGLFKNLKINKDISWGKADVASKVYGLYENNIQKVLEEIKKNSPKNSTANV